MDLKLTKKQLRVLILLVVFIIALPIVIIFATSSKSSKPELSIENCKPTFRDGGGPYYKENSPFRTNIAPDSNKGQKLVVEGYVLDSDCSNVVPGAIVDIWQASEEGEYEDDYYRGQVVADKDGYYKFKTVVPLGYGEGTAYRPPHIHFKVFVDDAEIVTSQMFFDDVRGREGFNDEYIILIQDEGEIIKGSHNIVLPDFQK